VISPETVEKAARALAVADGKDPDAPAWIRFPSGQTEGICWRDQYAQKARAALEAVGFSDAPKDSQG
jgi:hypothetical protein